MLFRILLLVLSTIVYPTTLVAAFKITGAIGGLDPRTGSPPQRIEINQFATSGPAFDLFILALQRLQDTDQTDQLSYFQISGIHGFPTIPWDGVLGYGQNPGYCMHGAVTFPIWHRPYLALFEQVVWTHARSIATAYPPDQRAKYQAAANTLRIPYWDWASNASLPMVTVSPTIFVNSPSGWREVRNPLYRYDFHPGPEGNQFPSSHFLSNTPYTTRHPDSQWVSNQTAASAEMKTHEADIASLTYQLLTSHSSYSQFSCNDPGVSRNGANNIESIHNAIHNWVGGANGFMTWPEFAAFDPIFWLHHAQVDRIFAVWQALNPSNYIVPQSNPVGSYYELAGTLDFIDGMLAPFHSDAATAMFTPGRARNISILGYTYPELVGLPSGSIEQLAELRTRINNLYNSHIGSIAKAGSRATTAQTTNMAKAFSHVSLRTARELGVNNLEFQWSINIRIDRFSYNTSFALDFFMGPPPVDVKLWPTAGNLIGTFGQFRTADTMVAPYADVIAVQQQGEISITHVLAAAVWRGYLQNLTSEVVVPLLQRNLVWKARTQDHQQISLDELSGLSIMVESRVVRPSRNASEFPRYGRYRSHPAATAGKEGGVQAR